MFKKHVLLAYTDLQAAGSRALLGLDPEHHKYEYRTLPVPEVPGLKPACVRGSTCAPAEQEFQPIQILNCKYEEFSVVVVNAVVGGDVCHHVVSRLLDECLRSGVEKITAVAALHFPHPGELLYETAFFTQPGLSPFRYLTSAPGLPDDLQVADPILNLLVQFLLVDSLPATFLVVPGHKATEGAANVSDGSLANISLLQDTLTSITGLRFSRDISCSLLYKGTNNPQEAMVDLIYM
ncbi:Hypp5817 [Branchiostoma lanceolatum]|uniref:Hypp5817 protein n=1 Tax=Branchiostoma lanceolatum TaxID=7740 RepID=A0A8J9YRR8_BRALA|nr:Hypp5817 [Branchiostoma lanceolatum]